MRNALRKAWNRGRSLLPMHGFTFGRPLVVLQSDDWGRAGLRDTTAWEQMQDLTPRLGERAYDFYSLETAADLADVASLLGKHRDSTGRTACLEMNFIVANVDFARVVADDFRQIYLRPLTSGLPDGWERTGLFEAYREGISRGVFAAALHGTTHFCAQAVSRELKDSGERGALLRKMWAAGVPYIHWRMPWIGFEYWDPEQTEENRFLDAKTQDDLVAQGAAIFSTFFGRTPRSACAPGYRANHATQQAWAQHGIRVAQNGPGKLTPPHFGRNGLLQLYRNINFEPAVDSQSSVVDCLHAAENCFARGIPAIISIHSINFHSMLKDFRSGTLDLLDDLLTALEAKHPNLLYVTDENIVDLVERGEFRSADSVIKVVVTQKSFRNEFVLRRGA